MLHDDRQASQFLFVCVIYNIYIYMYKIYTCNFFFYSANLASSF